MATSQDPRAWWRLICRGQWKEQDVEEDRRRDGKITSKNRVGDSLRTAEDREGWKGIVATASVVARRPLRLRDWYDMSKLMRLWYFTSSIKSFFNHRHPDFWFLVRPFVYFHTLCVRTAKALVRPRGCAGSPEPSLVAYVISTIISWAGSYDIWYIQTFD